MNDIFIQNICSDLVLNLIYLFFLLQQLRELTAGPREIPILNNDQSELQYNIKIDPPGPYIFLVEYVTPIDRSQPTTSLIDPNNDVYNQTIDMSNKGTVVVKFQTGQEILSLLNLNDCPYTTPCRQVVVDEMSKIQVVNIREASNTIILEVSLFNDV